MKHSTLTFFNSARQFCRQKRNAYLHNTLHALSNSDSIKICRFEEGNGMQIFNSTNYLNKFYKLTLDKSEFCKIIVNDNKAHPVISKEKF